MTFSERLKRLCGPKNPIPMGDKLNNMLHEQHEREFAVIDTIHDGVKSLKAENTELRAALGVMLASWDAASLKLTEFMKDDKNKEKAEAYMATMQGLFDAAVAARTIYMRPRL